MSGGSAEEKSCAVGIHSGGRREAHTAKAGSNLYLFLKDCGLPLDAPCGGNGTCGKCLVRITDRSGSPYTEDRKENEKKLVGEKRLAMGYRLACAVAAFDGMEVFLPDHDAMKIMSQGKRSERSLCPIVQKTALHLDRPSPEDQSSDLERLERAWKRRQDQGREPGRQKGRSELSLSALRRFGEMLRSGDSGFTLVVLDGEITAAEPGDTAKTNYGIAFDIGTTTLVGYLVDLNTGREAGTCSAANPQRIFGADVISRIGYTLNDPEKLAEMNRAVLGAINAIIGTLVKDAGLSAQDVYAATFAGNTTMMHFLMKLPADGIASAPFAPVTTELSFWSARELGVGINEAGAAVIFPAVSAYVGADTVAAVLSTGMYRNEELSLLVDIGTNGEIVLGNRDGMVACSAAAGPAFEGAGIRNGVGSIRGAIDTVRLIPAFSYTTIGNAPAKGICGSGIVDAVAELLKAGVIDGSGKFVPDPSALPPGREALRGRLVRLDGRSAFLLAGRRKAPPGPISRSRRRTCGSFRTPRRPSRPASGSVSDVRHRTGGREKGLPGGRLRKLHQYGQRDPDRSAAPGTGGQD
jgi:uncharacterized 2Fe-2S/4Fe-4S cluster protein (DUF4445 family)